MERKFSIIVPPLIPDKPALVYPEQSGMKSLTAMISLKSRGFNPIARTTANSITEDLSLEDMREIYSN